MIKKILATTLLLNAMLFAGQVGSLKLSYESGGKLVSPRMRVTASPQKFEDEVIPKEKDWIGIYKKGDSNAWSNVITWFWAKDSDFQDKGQIVFYKHLYLQDGEYEARYFLNNSYVTFKKSNPITVKGIGEVLELEYINKSIKIFTNGGQHKPNPKDWIGIYKVGDDNSWGNVIEWIWAKDTHFDPIQDLGDPYKVFDLKKNYDPKEKYEARYFLNNSYTTFKKSKPFSVK